MASKVKVPVREQDPKVRATNFEEVCYGYNEEEAIEEAKRCLNCKNPRCVQGCPVSINIPDFISEVKEGNFEAAAKVIAKSSSLPAVCGRVCPQESQCEGNCVLGIKGEPVSIGKLERFVADWSRKHNIDLSGDIKKNGIKVAIIGSGPSGLACAGDLAKLGYEVTIFEAFHKAGGVLTYGIPEFRLPKSEVVDYEVNSIKNLGVKIETNVVVGRTVTIQEMFEEEGFKAVFIGSGAGLPSFMGIPGENANGVLSANEFLTRVNLMKAYRDDYDTPTVIISHAPISNEFGILDKHNSSYRKLQFLCNQDLYDLIMKTNIKGFIHGHHHITSKSKYWKFIEIENKRMFIVCSIFSRLNNGIDLSKFLMLDNYKALITNLDVISADGLFNSSEDSK